VPHVRPLLLLLALLWTAPALALDKLTVQMAFYPQGPQADMYLALDKGWYKDLGLDVQLLEGRGSNYSVQMLGAGNADIGEGELTPLVFARNRGAKIKIFAEWFANDGPCVIVPVESDIHDLKDLRGKRLIITAAGPWPPLLDSFLGQFGMTQQDVSLVYVSSSSLFSSYAVKQGDAMLSVPLAFTEANPVRPSKLFSTADYGVKLPGEGVFADEQTLTTKADQLARFVKATARALAYIYDGHEQDAAQAIHNQDPDAKLNEKVLMEQVTLFANMRFLPSTQGKPIGWQSPEEWKERLAYLERTKLLPPGHQPTEFYTNDIIDRAQH
jgi:NitT/TauT family transport system substrate-binding protein